MRPFTVPMYRAVYPSMHYSSLAYVARIGRYNINTVTVGKASSPLVKGSLTGSIGYY